jgi:hypothetical protein
MAFPWSLIVEAATGALKKYQRLGAHNSKKPTTTNNHIGSTGSIGEYQQARTEIREDGESRERR